MRIYDGQMIYNARPRYNITEQVLRTKIMPRGEVATVVEVNNGNGATVKVGVDENGEIVAVEKKANWGPLVAAAALAFVAMG